LRRKSKVRCLLICVSSLTAFFLIARAVPAGATSDGFTNQAKSRIHFSAGNVRWVGSAALTKMLEERRRQEISFYLVDLRLEADYQKGHIPGAINIPSQKLRFLAEKFLAG